MVWSDSEYSLNRAFNFSEWHKSFVADAGGVYGAGYGGLTGYGGMGGMGMYSSPMMGGYGGYSPYNRMGMGYGQSMGDMNNSFIQMAEASSRGAFHSVESVVSAVSSVSMMLESTYFALQNSFRAVLGVADQFSRLKMQLSQVAASFAVFKFIRWLYRRLLVLLGLRKAGLSDDAWTNALKKSAEEAQDRFPGQKKSSWPLVLFFAIALGGPYMIWRMISNMYKGKVNICMRASCKTSRIIYMVYVYNRKPCTREMLVALGIFCL